MKKIGQKIKKLLTRRETERVGEVSLIILGLIGASGIVVAGAMAPGLLYLLKPLIREERKQKVIKNVDQSLKRLRRRHWIKWEEGPHGWRLTLTEKGLKQLMAYETKQTHLAKPKRWDKKWRVVIFDIPEQKRHLRDRLRFLLSEFGFVRLQDSVWVYPYECQEVMELLRTHYHIRYEALYFRAEYLDKDRWLKKQFDLENA